MRECIDYIEEHGNIGFIMKIFLFKNLFLLINWLFSSLGLACESIYKISGLKSKVRHLKSQYNKREKIYLYEHEPHIVASLLKQFLRDLPEPILTTELSPKFEEAAGICFLFYAFFSYVFIIFISVNVLKIPLMLVSFFISQKILLI